MHKTVPTAESLTGSPKAVSPAGAAGKADSESPIRRTDTWLGFSMLVEAGDYSSALIVRDGVFEIPETDLVTRLVRPGDVCIDGGCHIGYYTCLMAQLTGPSGRVYAFDANPWCCQRTQQNLELNGFQWAEVIHAALGNEHGNTPFHVATDDQTGLSSLGRIERPRKIISVPWLRLEDFLNERRIQKIRLLKLDVEGAEKLVLLGLGKILSEHRVDFFLLECYDERLRLLQCSTKDVAAILRDGGYVPWEYGAEHPSGWSRAAEVRSRGDCNYLFASPEVSEHMPSTSLAGALAGRSKALEEQQSKIDALSDALRKSNQEQNRLVAENQQLSATLQAVLQSKGWRLLRFLRDVRNVLLCRPREGR